MGVRSRSPSMSSAGVVRSHRGRDGGSAPARPLHLRTRERQCGTAGWDDGPVRHPGRDG